MLWFLYILFPLNTTISSPASTKTLLLLLLEENLCLCYSLLFQMSSRKGASAMCTVHEFDGTFRDSPAYYKVTSVVGHVYSYLISPFLHYLHLHPSSYSSYSFLMLFDTFRIDFLPQYQNWETVDPSTLFDAPTRKEEANPKVSILPSLSVLSISSPNFFLSS